MEFNVINKDITNSKEIAAMISGILNDNPLLVYGVTIQEFIEIYKWDILNIMAFYYDRIDDERKEEVCTYIEMEFDTENAEQLVSDVLTKLKETPIYIPNSCKLIKKIDDVRLTAVVYESLFIECTRFVMDNWNRKSSGSDYLTALNAAYFEGISKLFKLGNCYKQCMKKYYDEDRYESLLSAMYEQHKADIQWDSDIDFNKLDEIIDYCKKASTTSLNSEQYDALTSLMDHIKNKHTNELQYETEREGFDLLKHSTGIKEIRNSEICGYECHFCLDVRRKYEYIVVYQGTNDFSASMNTDEWGDFLEHLYKDDFNNTESNFCVNIVFIIDEDADSIPIQRVEGNKEYARKYVFTEEEAIIRIKGITNGNSERNIGTDPVKVWDEILTEANLSACLTEPYAKKKVESYLDGNDFDSDYAIGDDYKSHSSKDISKIKWIKSLDTTDFREFCFNDKVIDFGQVNLFYGANGTGKTSVLEGIEYGLTSEVRRIKDFKTDIIQSDYPRVEVYGEQGSIHTFNPEYSKSNAKKIENVWYGVPIGRTKTNLNENFNRFNSFDSEAAYNFIHDTDSNDEDSYTAMFGNLLYGETVVDHEKKWNRFKLAFEEADKELQGSYSEANESKTSAEYWIGMYQNDEKAQDIERLLQSLSYKNEKILSQESDKKYEKLYDNLLIDKKYVDALNPELLDEMTFGKMIQMIKNAKTNNQRWTKEKKEDSDKIAELIKENVKLKSNLVTDEETLDEIITRITAFNSIAHDWEIVEEVLNDRDSISRAGKIETELDNINKDIWYINKIEQIPDAVELVKMDDPHSLSKQEKGNVEKELDDLRQHKKKLDNDYAEAKNNYNDKEQKAIELRKMGKALANSSKCPLCGHEYKDVEELNKLIDGAVTIDDGMDILIGELEKLSQQISDKEDILNKDTTIERGLSGLEELKNVVPMVESCGDDYNELYKYINSKKELEANKEKLIGQQIILDNQGFSHDNIRACYDFKQSNPVYLEFKSSNSKDFSRYLDGLLSKESAKRDRISNKIANINNTIEKNDTLEVSLQNTIRGIDVSMENLDMETIIERSKAINNIKGDFKLSNDQEISEWAESFQELYDECELEVNRISSQEDLNYAKEMLTNAENAIRRLEPRIERCNIALQIFEEMPTLNSFVEDSIKSNLEMISNYFVAMHHSGEFRRLMIDSAGLYAIRGYDNSEVRLYEMSTGQRATIAMSVMLALHYAALDAPKFLLLDEPLATMDDVQVLNVLDIIKDMADRGTQIFFTTANTEMVRAFKNAFRDTNFDYKEFEFISEKNAKHQIRESSVNDVEPIEQSTIRDFIINYSDLKDIRDSFNRIKDKLIDEEDVEDLSGIDDANDSVGIEPEAEPENDCFYDFLSASEDKLLGILAINADANATELSKELSPYPNYKSIVESINAKAVDYYGETIVENDDALPFIYDDYVDELKDGYQEYHDRG